MSTQVRTWTVAVLLVLALALASCGGATPAEPTTAAPAATEPAAAPAELVPVSVQMPWVTQSQFAGYYAAREMGYYTDEGLDVTILEGSVDIVPEQVVASGVATFGVACVPKVLVAREQGTPLVNIGQVYQRSGSRMVAWTSDNIKTIEDFRGKVVANWGYGNEFELLAALENAGIDKDTDVQLVQQPFDMSLMLNHEVDVSQAMIYNEYAQVLESINPETGELYKPEDVTVIDFADVNKALLEDAIFTSEEWLSKPGNEDVAVKFLAASFKGWVYCRDNFDACVQIVLKNGSTLGASHMAFQLNEVNNLIWPSAYGIGVMDPNLWAQTVDVSTSQGLLTQAPDEGAYRDDLAKRADDALTAAGIDVFGKDYVKLTVEVAEGGE